MRLLKEGWELGCDMTTFPRSALGTMTCRLQKNGLGHGEPMENAKYATIESLEKKGLILSLENKYPSLQPTRFLLTDEGRKMVKSEPSEVQTINKVKVIVRIKGEVVSALKPHKIFTKDGLHGMIVSDGRPVTKEGDKWIYDAK